MYPDTLDVELWIPTKNSEKSLHATLAAARALDPKPKRVRIIDGGSSDDTSEIADSFDVEIVDQGNTRGLSGGRNVALELTTTEYIAFVDDDIQSRPDWLGSLVDELEATGAAAATAPIQHYPTTLTERWGVKRLEFNDPGNDRETHRIPGANGVYRVSALESIGGWDPEGYPFGGEDVDLSRRLRVSHELRHVPETCVVHVPAGGIEPMIKLWHWHTQGGPPNSIPALLPRALEHVGKSIKYLYSDITSESIGFYILDLAVAPIHTYLDCKGYFTNR